MLMQKTTELQKSRIAHCRPQTWFRSLLCAIASLNWDSGTGGDQFLRVNCDDLLSPTMPLVRPNHAEYKGDYAEHSGSSRANDRRLDGGMRAKPDETPTKQPGHTEKPCEVNQIRASLTSVGFAWTSWSKPTLCRRAKSTGFHITCIPATSTTPRSPKMNCKDYSLELIWLL